MNRADQTKKLLKEIILCAFGRFLFAVSVNTIITPLNLYSVGFTGLAQLLRTFCITVLGIQAPSGMDLTGVFFYLLSIPTFFLAWFGVSKPFFWKTMFVTTISSIFMILVPVPDAPILDDVLTLCIIGGVLAGGGAGLALRAGGSGGGQDVIGVYLARKYPNMSVGIVSFIISLFIYCCCLVYFDLHTLIYSFIYSTIISMSLDKVHYQNIKVLVEIDTCRSDLREKLAYALNRNVMMNAETGDGEQQYYHLKVVITKQEEKRLISLVHGMDPDAFLVMGEDVLVSGQFTKPIS